MNGFRKIVGIPRGFLGILAWLGAVCWLAMATVGCSGRGPRDTRYSLLRRLDAASVESPSPELHPAQLWLASVGGEERPALVAHAPSRLRFENVPIGRGATLEFGCGLDDGPVSTQASVNGVRFEVAIAEGDSSPRTLWSQDIVAGPGGHHWQDETLDLSAYAGRQVDVVLSTGDRGDPRGDWAVWSGLVVRSRAGRREPAKPPIPRSTIVRDLLEDAEVEAPAAPAGAARPPRRPCVFRTRLSVDKGMALDFAGQALVDPELPKAPLGPVRLALRVDGEPIYEREVTTPKSLVTLSDVVSLDAQAGRKVDLEFEMCDVARGNTMLWAKRLWLTRTVPTPRAPASEGPNLLFLLVDTLRADRLSVYGSERDTSPTLEALADKSRVFDRAISQCSWTIPSVATLLTGLSPVEHGVVEAVPLETARSTLGEALQAAGFTTFGFSSNPIIGKLEGMHRGFETFIQIPWARAEHVNSAFLDWVPEQRDVRWFAYLHYIDPHSPYEAPPGERDRYTEGCDTRYAAWGGFNALSEAVNLGKGSVPYDQGDIDCLLDRYDGEIRYWDDQLSRLLAGLRERGLLKNTVIVVTADHGEEFLEHGKLGHGFHLYDESVHVPLLIYAPGRVKPGRESRPVETRLVRETVLKILGVDADGLEEPSLLAAAPSAESLAFSQTTEGYRVGLGFTPLAAVRDERWKYILWPEDRLEELYDLRSDPAESTNLAGTRKAKLESYRDVLARWLAGAKPHTLQTRGIDPQTLEKLRALDYIR